MDGFTNQINNISLKKTKIVALYLHFYLNVFETFSFEMLNIYKTLKLEKYIELRYKTWSNDSKNITDIVWVRALLQLCHVRL